MLERSEGKRDLSANGNRGVFENGGENFLMVMVVTDGLHNSVNTLQTTELYNSKGETAWYVSCISIKILFKKEKGETWEFPGDPVTGGRVLSMQGTRIQFLAEELIFHKLHMVQPKKTTIKLKKKGGGLIWFH